MHLHDYTPRPAHIKWLLDSDPAIRWQVMQDLTGEAPEAIAAERSRVATEGWGAQLLARQSPAGHWGEGQKWDLITLYSLDALANQLLGEQLEDGGWNCEAWPFLSPKRPPSRRSSFHTTICVLEGLLEYERAERKSAAVTKARKRAENYLLERRMFRSRRTGRVIDKRWLRFSFPTFWHYDVLRGLDYLRNAGIKPDSRVREAIKIVIERRHQNGRWPLNLLHPEHIPLEMETDIGGASRWNTLRALRVLRWYNNSTC